METKPEIRRIAILCALGAALLASAVAGQALESYRNGKNALEDGRLADAERLFHEAIAERNEERIRIGQDYLPHYYLGVTLARLNRCREALLAWRESERQGQIGKAPKEGPELPGQKQECIDRVRSLEDAQRAAEQAVAQARKTEQTLVKLRGTAELEAVWGDGNPSFDSREQAAHQRLEEAARRLAAAANAADTTPSQEARSLANQAADEMDTLMTDARARLASIRDVASSALERLEAAEQTAHSALGDAAYLKPYPPGLKSHVDAVRRALDATVKKKATASSRELGALHGTLTDAVSQLRRAAQGPPKGLRSAAEAFLAGRYDEVLATLDGETYRDPRASGQACLLRSAARHALYVSGGEQDAEMGAVLYQEVLDCQTLLPASEIRTAVFSPRFLSFYEDPVEPEPPEPEAESEDSDVEGEGDGADTAPADASPPDSS